MSTVGIYFVLLVIAGTAVAVSVSLGRRRGTTGWVLLILLCFVLGAIWQEAALRVFAAREQAGMNGLILRPIAFGGGDHELAPRGAHYFRFAFVIPGTTAVAAAVLVSFLALALKRRAAAVPVTVATVLGFVTYGLFAIARLLAASDIFI